MAIEDAHHELGEGISGSLIAMHFRDIAAAADAVEKYLGKDSVAPKPAYTMTRSELSQYFAAHCNPEVPAALAVIEAELTDRPVRLALRQDVIKNKDKIAARFPELTQERVDNILALTI